MIIELRSTQVKYNSNDRLVMTGMVTPAYYAETIVTLWTGEQCERPGDEPKIWDMINFTSSIPPFLSTLPGGRNLAVNQHQMTAGHMFRFRLTANGRDGAGSAEYVLTINIPPVGGNCSTLCAGLGCDAPKVN